MARKRTKPTYYELIDDIVHFLKNEYWDYDLTTTLTELFNPLLYKISARVNRLYGNQPDTYDTVRSFFLELVYEYNPEYQNKGEDVKDFKKVYFARYVTSHLYFRVEKFVLKNKSKALQVEDIEKVGKEFDTSEDSRILFYELLDASWKELGDLGEDITLLILLRFKQVEIARILGFTQAYISRYYSFAKNYYHENIA